VAIILSTLCNNFAFAENPKPQEENRVSIQSFLSAYFNKNKLKAIIDPRVKGKLTIYGINDNNINYNTVLLILSMHGYVAIKDNEIISVVPSVTAKQITPPIVKKGGKYLSNEIVTDIIKLKYADAGSLIPILRPLVPQRGYLAAHPPSGQIIITDTYKNILNIKQIISSLDIKEQKITDNNKGVKK